MTNLLERAISTDEADRAASLFRKRLAFEAMTLSTTSFRKLAKAQNSNVLGEWLQT